MKHALDALDPAQVLRDLENPCRPRWTEILDDWVEVDNALFDIQMLESSPVGEISFCILGIRCEKAAACFLLRTRCDREKCCLERTTRV